MDFSYSEAQNQVRELATQILADHTEADQLKRIEQSGERFDEKLWSVLAEAGLLGIAMPESAGGMELGYEALAVLFEEVGRTVAPVPVVPVLSTALALARFAGDDTQALLGKTVAGQALVTAALTEPCSDLGTVTRATATATAESGDYHVSGIKICVPFAQRAEAVVVPALLDGRLAMFLVHPGTNGVTLIDQVNTAGEPQSEMHMDHAQASVLATGDTAQMMYDWLLNTTATGYAQMAVGLCDNMVKLSASYTSERHQFGVPVATFQAVGHQVADCFIDVECLRLVTQEAVSLIDQDLPVGDSVIVAKIWTGDVTHRVSQTSQQVHGGMGVDRDYPLFRYALWARQLELTIGSSAELRELLGREIAAEFAA